MQIFAEKRAFINKFY